MLQISGESSVNEEPALVYRDGSVCRPNFYFGPTFENLEMRNWADGGGQRRIKSMLNYRTAYSQDGFFICGVLGLKKLRHFQRHEVLMIADVDFGNSSPLTLNHNMCLILQCCYWSKKKDGANECKLLDHPASLPGYNTTLEEKYRLTHQFSVLR